MFEQLGGVFLRMLAVLAVVVGLSVGCTVPPGSPAIQADTEAGGPPVGRYSCLRLGTIENEIAPDLTILDGRRYESLGNEGSYSYDAATRMIEWRDGPLSGDGAWVGVYFPQGAETAYDTIAIRDRADVEAGNERDLQWCNLAGQEPVAPVEPDPASRRVVYEVDGTGTAYVNLQGEAEHLESVEVTLPYTAEYSLNEGTHAYIRVEPVELGGSVSCRIYVDGALLVEQAEASYVVCDGPVGAG